MMFVSCKPVAGSLRQTEHIPRPTKNLNRSGVRCFVSQDDNGLCADCWVDRKRRDRHAKEARDDRELADWKHSQASVRGLSF